MAVNASTPSFHKERSLPAPECQCSILQIYEGHHPRAVTTLAPKSPNLLSNYTNPRLPPFISFPPMCPTTIPHSTEYCQSRQRHCYNPEHPELRREMQSGAGTRSREGEKLSAEDGLTCISEPTSSERTLVDAHLMCYLLSTAN